MISSTEGNSSEYSNRLPQEKKEADIEENGMIFEGYDSAGFEDGCSRVSQSQDEPSDIEKQEAERDPDVDGGYGYVIIIAAFLINFNTWGMNSGFAIYFSYYLNNNTFEGATKIDYSFIGGIAFGVGICCSPIINFTQGLLGTRRTIIVGNCIQFTALMLASWSRKLWQLYLTQGLLQSFGLAFISLPALTILPQYFKKKRTLATSIAAAGSGVGGICFNLGMQSVIATRSVFWALRCQSIIAFGLVWISIALIRDKAKTHKIEFTIIDMQCLRCAGFWILTFYIVSCMLGYVIVLYTLANFTTSLGYSEHQGSIVAAMVSVGICFGRPAIGMASDKFGPITMSFAAYLVSAILCLAMWIPARNYATVIVFAILMGALMGTIFSTFAPTVARLVGLAKLNVTFCMTWIFVGVAGIFSPVIGVKLIAGDGNLVDPTQYLHCSIFTGIAFLICSLTLLVLRGYILARDSLVDEDVDSDQGAHLDVQVPFLLALSSCFKWTKKRA